MTDSDFQRFLDELMLKNDIVDVISEYTVLKRSGNRMMGLCPLHNDKKSPSLSVSPDKQLFHCFGCGAGGSVIQFIEAAMNLDFMDAVKYLADRVHMTVPSGTGGGQSRERRQAEALRREKLYKLNAEAARYFYSCLSTPEGVPGAEYLIRRQISRETIIKFGLGYAPEGWSNLINYLTKKGYTENDMLTAGLVKKRDNGTFYDAFYDGRVIFPIIDVRGNVIGFGGRVVVDGGNAPKYWNTPETPVFKKKDNLFGMNIAKSSKSDRLLLMEGYMDVVSLHQNGFDNAVASLGTAFTPEQAAVVKRYSGRAVLCYDNDDAGKKATIRAGDILYDAGIKVRVLDITDGKDPDEFIKAKGPEMFSVMVEKAKPFIDYKIDEARKKYNLSDVDDRVDFLDDATKILASIKNGAQREIYANKLSDELHISRENIESGVLAYESKKQSTERRRNENRLRRETEAVESGGYSNREETELYHAERFLLGLLPDKRVYNEVLRHGIMPEDFVMNPMHRRAAELIFDTYKNGEKVEAYDILNKCTPEEIGDMTNILMCDKGTRDMLAASGHPIKVMLKAKNNRAILKAGSSNDVDELNRLYEQMKNVKNSTNGGRAHE